MEVGNDEVKNCEEILGLPEMACGEFTGGPCSVVSGPMEKASTREIPEIYHLTSFFTGRVQGVGFRYHTLQIAKEFEVSGTVRNLADGRVFLDAEGEENEVRSFIHEVDDRLGVFIRKTERDHGHRPRRYRGFSIS